MTNIYEGPLVGPRSDDEREKNLEQEVNEQGQPLYMAFLADPEALSVSADEIQDAKNAFAQLKDKHPEVISMCAHKKIDECKTYIQSIREAA